MPPREESLLEIDLPYYDPNVRLSTTGLYAFCGGRGSHKTTHAELMMQSWAHAQKCIVHVLAIGEKTLANWAKVVPQACVRKASIAALQSIHAEQELQIKRYADMGKPFPSYRYALVLMDDFALCPELADHPYLQTFSAISRNANMCAFWLLQDYKQLAKSTRPQLDGIFLASLPGEDRLRDIHSELLSFMPLRQLKAYAVAGTRDMSLLCLEKDSNSAYKRAMPDESAIIIPPLPQLDAQAKPRYEGFPFARVLFGAPFQWRFVEKYKPEKGSCAASKEHNFTFRDSRGTIHVRSLPAPEM